MEGNRPGGREGWFGLQIGVSRWSSQPWDWSEWRGEPVREQKPGRTNADRLLRRALQQRGLCGVGERGVPGQGAGGPAGAAVPRGCTQGLGVALWTWQDDD